MVDVEYLNHIDLPPPTPPCVGSPASLVAAVLLENTVPALIPSAPAMLSLTYEMVTEFDGDDDGLVPVTFRATTVNVYEFPFDNPATVHERVDVVQVYPPGDEVTVYEEIVEPPFDEGADHDTVAEFSPATALTEVGAPGTDPTAEMVHASENDPAEHVPDEYPATLT
jgi:hypothetical protein